MPVITSPSQFVEDDLYVDLTATTGQAIMLKIEGLNLAGSIKLKAARAMVDAAERDGRLHRDSIIVESSSGNLGVALSMIAADRGYRFICITDTRCNLATRQLMQALGAEVRVVTEPHPVTGYLGARLEQLHALRASSDRYVWLDQYANPANADAHYRETGPAISRRFPDLDVVFIGAGSCGTLMGCARWFREWHRPVYLVAVDAVGSVLFGGPAGNRVVPGLGSGVTSPVLDPTLVDEVMLVEERDTVRECHRLARGGFLFGGSTGTVVHAARTWLAARQMPLRAVAIAPDLGERYLDTLYQSSWVSGMFGAQLLDDTVNGAANDAGRTVGSY